MPTHIPLEIVQRILDHLYTPPDPVEQYVDSCNPRYTRDLQVKPQSDERRALLQCRLVSRGFCDISSKYFFQDIKIGEVEIFDDYMKEIRGWLASVDSPDSTVFLYARTFSFRIRMPHCLEDKESLLCSPEHPLNVLSTSLSRLWDVAQTFPASDAPVLELLKINFGPSRETYRGHPLIDWSASTVPSSLANAVRAVCASDKVTRTLWMKNIRCAPSNLFHGMKVHELVLTGVREDVELGIDWKRLPNGSWTTVRLPKPDPDFVPPGAPESRLTVVTTDGIYPLSPSRHKIRDLTFVVDSNNDDPTFVLRQAGTLEVFRIQILEPKSKYRFKWSTPHGDDTGRTLKLRDMCTEASFARLKKLTIEEGYFELGYFNAPTAYIDYHFNLIIDSLNSFNAFTKAPLVEEIVLSLPLKTASQRVAYYWLTTPRDQETKGWAALDIVLLQLLRDIRVQNRPLPSIKLNVQVFCEPPCRTRESGPLTVAELESGEQYWRETGWASTNIRLLLPDCVRFFPGSISISTSFTSMPAPRSFLSEWCKE